MGTLAMGLGYPKGKLTSLEGCPQTAQTAREYLERVPIKPNVLTSEFRNFLQEDKGTYDLVYIDGHHEKEASLSYFDSLLDKTNNDSLLIFDDIHWSQGMTAAWKEISNHPRVTVSIDLYFWGR